MTLLEKTKKDIIHLYQEDKLSMTQIAEKLKIHKSAVGYYLQKNKIPRRSWSEASTAYHFTRFHKKPFSLKTELTSREEQLKVAGMMIYWGEGTKEGSVVTLTNSDPKMIKVFLCFLREICGVNEERLRIVLHLYPDQGEDSLKRFWSELTGIPLYQFSKTFTHTGRVGTYKKKSQYGTVSLRYSDKRLLEQIILWIREYADQYITPE